MALLSMSVTCGAACAAVVNTAGDPGLAGTLSLRQAVAAASAGDTITFDPALNGSTITLQSGQIAITQPIDIEGPGANNLTVSGNNASRIFSITSASTTSPVIIRGLQISNGKTSSGKGGAIYSNAGAFSLYDSVVKSSVNSADFGGGLSAKMLASTKLTLNGVTLQGNTGVFVGGAFVEFKDTSSRAYFTNCLISGNSGGVMLLLDTGSTDEFQVTIDNTRIVLNSGTGATLGASTLMNRSLVSGNGTGIDQETGYLKMTDSTVSSNLDGAPPLAGGITVRYQATAKIFYSTISGNAAAGPGGGLEAQLSSLVQLNHSAVIDNHATGASGRGGGLALASGACAEVIDSTFYGNYASADGGGVALLDNQTGCAIPRLTLTSSTIVGNSTNAGSANGVYSIHGTTIDSTIVANNYSATNRTDIGGTALFSVGYSLVQTPGTANITNLGHLITGVDPLLGPLAVNGGPTLSLLPAANSPVIDKGDPLPPSLADQRGVARVVNGHQDIGAVERQSPEVIIFRDGFELQ